MGVLLWTLQEYNVVMADQILYRKLLGEIIKLKSISTDSVYAGEIEKTAKWLEKLFGENGFRTQVITGYDNPIVIAEYVVSAKVPTCLVYGHYDVQPAEINDGWMKEPFELAEMDGRLYGRGVVDNKGQFLVHVATVISLIKEKKLGCNVKFMIEGNEETGSPAIEEFVKKNKDLLKADFTLISDGEMNLKQPNIEAGFRGGFNSTLTITSGKTDLHSGIYGGAVPSSALEMVKFIASLYDENNSITVEEFYDDVDEIKGMIKKNNEELPFDEPEYLKVAGVKALVREKGFDVNSQVALRPSIQVTGFQSGYVGEGYRNSIPARTVAKINFRLVKSQNPNEIIKLFREHLKKVMPDYVEYEFVATEPYEGIKLDLDNEIVTKTKQILEKVYGEKVVFKFSGGGLPIVTLFDQTLKIPNVLVPLGNEDCAMHAPNENYDLKYLDKSLSFSREFFSSKW